MSKDIPLCVCQSALRHATRRRKALGDGSIFVMDPSPRTASLSCQQFPVSISPFRGWWLTSDLWMRPSCADRWWQPSERGRHHLCLSGFEMHHIKDPTQNGSPEWWSGCFCSDMLELCGTVWKVFTLQVCPVVHSKYKWEIQSHTLNTKMINSASKKMLFFNPCLPFRFLLPFKCHILLKLLHKSLTYLTHMHLRKQQSSFDKLLDTVSQTFNSKCVLFF